MFFTSVGNLGAPTWYRVVTNLVHSMSSHGIATPVGESSESKLIKRLPPIVPVSQKCQIHRQQYTSILHDTVSVVPKTITLRQPERAYFIG
jgi:hypothetical protein